MTDHPIRAERMNQVRWFGGRVPSGRSTPVPVGAAHVWSTPPLWTLGPWNEQRVRTYEDEQVRFAVFGACSAERAQLAEAAHLFDPTTVSGSWAGTFTIVRSVRGRVEIFTDASGACPIYTTRLSDGSLLWGSSSRALAALHGFGLDLDWMAAYLGDKHAVPRDRSAWAGVLPTPGGHRLLLTAGSMTMTRWWKPTSRPRAEALGLLRSALVEGVRSRIDGCHVSSDLSGVDSTTLVVIASRFGPITGVTAHPEHRTEGGDLEHVRALNVPELTRKRFEVTDRDLPFSSSAGPLPPTDEPPPSAVSWAAFAGQLRSLGSAGPNKCHLTGDGGDNLFLPPPTHLVSLARRRQWVNVWRDACAWARLCRRAPWPYVRAALAGDVAWLARSTPSAPPWLRCAMSERTEPTDANEALIALISRVARAAASDTQLADHIGVEQHNPYFDGTVLDAVVSLPAADRFSAHRYKPALMDAVGDLLPASVRTRATKGSFVADYHRAVRIRLDGVLDMCEGPLTEAGLVDGGRLRSTVRAAALGARVPWGHLLTTMGAHLWWKAALESPVPRWSKHDGAAV